MADELPATGRAVVSTSEWIGVGSAFAGLLLTHVWAVFRMAAGIRTEISQLDKCWQDRIAGIVKDIYSEMRTGRGEIKEEIEHVRAQIPPDWFRKMVEQNQADIRSLVERVHSMEIKNHNKGDP